MNIKPINTTNSNGQFFGKSYILKSESSRLFEGLMSNSIGVEGDFFFEPRSFNKIGDFFVGRFLTGDESDDANSLRKLAMESKIFQVREKVTACLTSVLEQFDQTAEIVVVESLADIQKLIRQR